MMSSPNALNVYANDGAFRNVDRGVAKTISSRAIDALATVVMSIDALTMLSISAFCFSLLSATNFVDEYPNPNVAKAANWNIVVLTNPYSPYKSFPSILAMMMPERSIRP